MLARLGCCVEIWEASGTPQPSDRPTPQAPVEVPSFPGRPLACVPGAHGCSDSSFPTTSGQTQPPAWSWQDPDTWAKAREPAGEEKEERSRRRERPDPGPRRQVTSTFSFPGLSPKHQKLTRGGIRICEKTIIYRLHTTHTHKHDFFF